MLCFSFSLGDEPSSKHRQDISLLFVAQSMSLGDRVPFLKAASAAGRGGVLSDENRVVVPHRCLLAVVQRIGGGEPLLDELLAVLHHGVQPPAFQVVLLSDAESGPATKGRPSQPPEDIIQVATHRTLIQPTRTSS